MITTDGANGFRPPFRISVHVVMHGVLRLEQHAQVAKGSNCSLFH